MEANFLPEELIDRCRPIVRALHEKQGLGALPEKAAAGNYMTVLYSMADTSSSMRDNGIFFKYMIGGWVAAAFFLMLSFAYTWWLLIGVVGGVMIARRYAVRQRDCWIHAGTVLLGMEILAADFCGWGTAYPQLRDRALALLDDHPSRPRTTWLDYYLPERSQWDRKERRAFGPEKGA